MRWWKEMMEEVVEEEVEEVGDGRQRDTRVW